MDKRSEVALALRPRRLKRRDGRRVGKRRNPRKRRRFMPFKRRRNREQVGWWVVSCALAEMCFAVLALLDLRKNFEADKARVEKLKESRRFKPY